MREEEAVGEAQQKLRHGLAEGEAGERVGWAAEAAERTCPAGTEGEEGAQRWELWRGEEVEGHLAPWLEEGEVGQSHGVGAGEGGRLWTEGAEELVSAARS